MKIKTIVVLLIISLASIMFAGCIGDDEPIIEETIPEDVIDETPEEVEEIPVEEPEVEEETPVIDPQTHSIRLEYYQARPTTLEINRGDTVVWRNSQDPKRIFTLVSEDGLWEDTGLSYGRTLVHTFNKSGTYNFSVPGQLRMNVSIVVN